MALDSLLGTLCSLLNSGESSPKNLVFSHSEGYDKFFHKESQHILVETSPCQRGCFATIRAFKQGWDNHNNYVPLAKWSGTRFFLRFSEPPFWSREHLNGLQEHCSENYHEYKNELEEGELIKESWVIKGPRLEKLIILTNKI